jgi:hypothetical protein
MTDAIRQSIRSKARRTTLANGQAQNQQEPSGNINSIIRSTNGKVYQVR